MAKFVTFLHLDMFVYVVYVPMRRLCFVILSAQAFLFILLFYVSFWLPCSHCNTAWLKKAVASSSPSHSSLFHLRLARRNVALRVCNTVALCRQPWNANAKIMALRCSSGNDLTHVAASAPRAPSHCLGQMTAEVWVTASPCGRRAAGDLIQTHPPTHPASESKFSALCRNLSASVGSYVFCLSADGRNNIN